VADAAADLRAELGLSRSAIASPGESTSTREDALTVYALAQRRDRDTIRLVTSASHMLRAVAVFRSVGVTAEAVPSDYQSVDAAFDKTWRWLPDKMAFDWPKEAWHE
jgi:uncharacterized SAM-binding protein YcdF (DUF218 family)